MKRRGNPIVYLFRMILRFSKDYRRDVRLYWTLFILANIVGSIIHPFAMAKILNSLQKYGITSENIRLIFGLLGLSLFSTCAFWIFHGPGRVIEKNLAYKVEANFRAFLMRGVLFLPLDWHSDHHTGDTSDKVRKGTAALFGFSIQSFQVVMFAVQFVIAIAVIGWISVWSIPLIVIWAVIVYSLTRYYDERIYSNQKKIAQYENAISAEMADNINNISTVITLRVEDQVFASLSKKLWAAFGVWNENNKTIEWKWFYLYFSYKILFVALLGQFLWSLNKGHGGVVMGSVYLLINYLGQMENVLFAFAGKYNEILKFRADVENSEEVSEHFTQADFIPHVLPKSWERIRMVNLKYSYPGSSRLQLDDVSLDLHRGERMALIGGSGEGKTTLLKILRNLHKPNDVRLEVDGKVVEEGLAGISQSVALVPQIPEIFTGTVRTNLTLGIDYDEESINRALELSHFKTVVNRLPKGLDSMINEKGVNLSGGERQRLALARGLLVCHEKSIILLDEPTSSVDSKNQVGIFKGVLDGFQGSTVLVSTHQLNLLSLFDRIILFEKGKVVVQGSFSEVLSHYKFQELWNEFEKSHPRSPVEITA